MANLENLIQELPKAELHLHIEGTLEPELMFELAGRNGIPLKFNSVAEVRQAYEFSNLQSFLDIYYEGAQVLREKEDFFDLTWAYLERVAGENVRHVEIFFDPQTHTERGVPFGAVIRGIHNALNEARVKLGVSSRLIMCFLRHLPEEQAMLTLEQAMPYMDWIDGVGLDSGEQGNPPVKFQEVFARCRKLNLHLVAHAGEEGPPAYIREALDRLHVERIDHGVRCTEDPQLVKELAEKQIPLTVCPLSNIKLRVFDRLQDHNLRELLQSGLCVMINSDDPAYFGGYLMQNYLACQTELGLTKEEIVQLAKNSFTASFLPESEKRDFLQQIDAVAAKH